MTRGWLNTPLKPAVHTLHTLIKFVVEKSICHGSNSLRIIRMLRVMPDGPWEKVGIDLFEFNAKWYAIFIDCYSSWMESPALFLMNGRV